VLAAQAEHLQVVAREQAVQIQYLQDLLRLLAAAVVVMVNKSAHLVVQVAEAVALAQPGIIHH
jgi:uncharacterized protein (DUF2345 family)